MTPTVSSSSWLAATKSTYPLWPERGSLACWGRWPDPGGGIFAFFYWRTAGEDPDRWPVVVWRRSTGFTEYPYGMAEYLVRSLSEAGLLPLHRREVFGAPYSRFIHWREEERCRSEGVDPWEYLEPLHEEYQERVGDVILSIADADGNPVDYTEKTLPEELRERVEQSRRRMTERQAAMQALARSVIAPGAGTSRSVPQLAVLGLRSESGGGLRVSASIALGAPGVGPLVLPVPLGVSGPSVEVTGPDGLVGAAFGVPVLVDGRVGGAGEVVVTGDRPFTFELVVPDSALFAGYDWRRVLGGSVGPGGPFSVNVVVTDPAIGALRAAAGVMSPAGTQDVLIGSWPPAVGS